jgi:hypothetical protein
MKDIVIIAPYKNLYDLSKEVILESVLFHNQLQGGP